MSGFDARPRNIDREEKKTLIRSASRSVEAALNCASINSLPPGASMGIKSDKTFEEIVERLVALVRPEQKETDTTAVPSQSPDDPVPDPEHASIPARPKARSNRRTR
jgi:hypothetical protein